MSNYQQLKRSAIATAGGYLDTGIIVPWSAASVPIGFLRCDGAAVSRTTYADLFAIVGTQYGAGDGVTTFNVPDLKAKQPYGDDDSTYVVGGTGGSTTAVGNIAVSDNRGLALSISSSTASANVALPVHTHFISAATGAANTGVGQAAITANTQLAQSGSGSDTNFRYSFVQSNSAASIGLTSSAGSGNGGHSHNFAFNSNNAVSFSGGSITATMNAVNTISPYLVCRFIIKT